MEENTHYEYVFQVVCLEQRGRVRPISSLECRVKYWCIATPSTPMAPCTSTYGLGKCVLVVAVAVVVLTLTRTIKSVATGQAPVTLELRRTPGKNTNNPRWYTIYSYAASCMPAPCAVYLEPRATKPQSMLLIMLKLCLTCCMRTIIRLALND